MEVRGNTLDVGAQKWRKAIEMSFRRRCVCRGSPHPAHAG
jgi:hypothetical protein